MGGNSPLIRYHFQIAQMRYICLFLTSLELFVKNGLRERILGGRGDGLRCRKSQKPEPCS